MKYSNIALKILAGKQCGIIKSNASFWTEYSKQEDFEKSILGDNNFDIVLEKLTNDILSIDDDNTGGICVFDKNFPVINLKVKKNSEKPYFLFYKGDIELLSDLNRNVAVIGLTNPDEKVIKREEEVVKKLVEKNLVIVSGLAKGCDSVAHRACLEFNGKTIAILPTQINKIYPAENKNLADEIVKKGGLLISEYYTEAKSKYEAVGRFVERDRLQAMFAKTIILIASYSKGQGDSGSRHAMEAANKYGIDRYILYNAKTDNDNIQFGLNRDLLLEKCNNKVQILQASSIENINLLVNSNITKGVNEQYEEQIKLL